MFNPNASGVLDKDQHARLVDNLDGYAKDAGIQPRWIAQRLSDTCVAKELPRRLRGGNDRGKIRTVHLRLTPRQYEHFEAALLANGARRPKNKRGPARKETALMRALRRP